MKRLLSLLRNDILKISVGGVLFIGGALIEHLVAPLPSLFLYIAALVFCGAEVFVDAVRGILRRDLLDEKFLMTVASIGAMIVGEWSEGVAVMLFFLVGETFERRAVKRSRSSIRALMDICPDEARVIKDGEEIMIDAEDVEVGAEILIRPGERVPLDCVIISGEADLDTSSMTGESMPRAVSEGCELDSGVVVINGALVCKTLRPSSESAAARVLALVENASENKSKEERFITRFSRFYTPIVVGMALLLATLPPIFGLVSFGEAIYRALIFLVISCPCALVISVPMAFFGGIGGAASRGILFKGANVFSKLSKVNTVCFDKTGTLTSGRFAVSRTVAIGMEIPELLYYAASCESASNHPVAECIRNSAPKYARPEKIEELGGLGVVARLKGETFAVGNAKLMKRLSVNTGELSSEDRAILVSRGNELIGKIYISDEIKEEAASAVTQLKDLGVEKTAVLSGDKYETALEVAGKVGIDETLAELSPEEKYSNLKGFISSSQNRTVFVGDGMNDAPSLAIADVGISMGSIGQGCAIEASDVVIMSDNLLRIPEAVLISRKTINISKQNIIFALGAKGLILVLGALGFANMWLAVFADVGVAVIAILNSMRALKPPRYDGRGEK